MFLIWSFLITNDVEHFFMGLLSICISPLEQYLFKFFAYLLICLFINLLIGLVVLYSWVVRVLHIFCTLVLYLIYYLQIFLLFYGLSFHFLDYVLWCTKVFNFDGLFFLLLLMFLVFYLITHYHIWGHKDLHLCFSKNFVV